MSLQGVDDVHGSDGLPLGMLGVGDGITDDVLEEYLQYATGLLVDEARDTFDTTSAGETTDGRLGDTLDVVSKNFPVALGTPLSETLTSFTATRHDATSIVLNVETRERMNSTRHSLDIYCRGTDAAK